MRRTQKPLTRGQISTNTNGVQSKTSSRGVGRTVSHPATSASPQLDQAPNNRRTIEGWIQDLPRKFSGIDGGVMKDLMLLALRYVKEVEVAAGYHQEAASALKELRERFSLWIDGESDLDRKLSESSPEVRELFVSHLTALVLVLSTGMGLFTSENQQKLVEDTNRVIEQASSIALFHLNESATVYPPSNMLEFFNATRIEIKNRIDLLYEALPITRLVVKPFDVEEPRQGDEMDPNEHKHRDPAIEQAHQEIRNMRITTVKPASESSIPHVGKNSRRPCAAPSKSSTKHSHDSTGSSSTPSIFSDSGTHSGAHPLSDTMTSELPSEIAKSISEPPSSSSTGVSSRCMKCKTIFSNSADLKNHLCRTNRITGFRRRVASFFSTDISDSIDLGEEEMVRICYRDHRPDKTYLALIDTGANHNFILRSIVEEHKLDATQICHTMTTILGHFHVSESVQPTWQFEKGSWRHQEYSFFVVDQIPNDIDMVVGMVVQSELGIRLVARRHALITHADYGDASNLEKQKYERQTLDATASSFKTRQAIKAKHAENLQKVAAANARRKTKPEDRMSQTDAAVSSDKRQ